MVERSLEPPAADVANSVVLLVAAALVVGATACDGDATASGAAVASIEITPPSLALTLGTARALSARVLDEAGSLPLAAMYFGQLRTPQ